MKQFKRYIISTLAVLVGALASAQTLMDDAQAEIAGLEAGVVAIYVAAFGLVMARVVYLHSQKAAKTSTV